jgi:hypothetical protein
VQSRARDPFADQRRVRRRATLEISAQLGVVKPDATAHLVQTKLELMILQPVRLAE